MMRSQWYAYKFILLYAVSVIRAFGIIGNIHCVPFWAHHRQTTNAATQVTDTYYGLPAQKFEGFELCKVEETINSKMIQLQKFIFREL